MLTVHYIFGDPRQPRRAGLVAKLDSKKNGAEAALPSMIGKYRLDRTIGQGTYGKVKLAFDSATGEKVAVKIIDKQIIENDRQVRRIQKEIRFLKLLNHPNIVTVYDVVETDTHIFVIMEYASGGELFDYIVAHKRVKEKEARVFFRQVISAVDYCHQNSVIHRDLKPENLLLNSDKTIKIIDFGFSNTFQFNDLLNTFCGSPFYAAPEMILGRRYEGPEVDMWSLGVILFALLCGHLPFDDDDVKELYRKISTASYAAPSYLSDEAKDLISKLIVVNPKNRATLDVVRTHPWVQEGYDGPPDSLLPPRAPIEVDTLDDDVIAKLEDFGYLPEDIEVKLLDDANPVNPIRCTYYLLQEFYAREDERFFKLKMGLQQRKASVSVDALSSIQEDEEMATRESTPLPPLTGARRFSKILDDLGRSETTLVGPTQPRSRRFSSAGHTSESSLPARSMVAAAAAAAQPLPRAPVKTAGSSPLLKDAVASPAEQADAAIASVMASVAAGSVGRKAAAVLMEGAGSEGPSSEYRSRRRLSLPAVEYTKKRAAAQGKDKEGRDTTQIRSLSGWFSVATTSSKSEEAVADEIARVLSSHDLAYERDGPFIFVCEDAAQKCTFEIEICQVTRMSLRGLHLKRIRGSIWTYKKIWGKLLAQMNL